MRLGTPSPLDADVSCAGQPLPERAMLSVTMKAISVLLLAATSVISVTLCAPALSQTAARASIQSITTSRDLRVYFVDVEGGQATLFVTPQGESLLIDTGWPEHGGRDADRIVAAAHEAGLTRIDAVLITHYHDDHVGGVSQLAARIPVGTFLDHGALYEQDHGVTEQGYNRYLQQVATGKIRRTTLRAGDRLPMRSLEGTVISSDGQVIQAPLPGAGQANPLCAQETAAKEDLTENGHSLGVLIRFAGVRILDLGDLTKDRERALTCPANLLGKIDIDVVSHHGWEQSSGASFVHTIQPRVAVMDNGAAKGGSTPVLDVFRASPGLQTLWQLHTSEEGRAKAGGVEHNTAAEYVANTPGTEGKMLMLTVHPDGSYDVRNDRTGKTVRYAARR